jgi:hypothetical protein
MYSLKKYGMRHPKAAEIVVTTLFVLITAALLMAGCGKVGADPLGAHTVAAPTPTPISLCDNPKYDPNMPISASNEPSMPCGVPNPTPMPI